MNNRNLSARHPFALFAGTGCFVQSLLAIIVTWLSNHAISAVLLWVFGADAQGNWDRANVVIRAIVSFFAAGISLPGWIITFILQLAIPTPFF